MGLKKLICLIFSYKSQSLRVMSTHSSLVGKTNKSKKEEADKEKEKEAHKEKSLKEIPDPELTEEQKKKMFE